MSTIEASRRDFSVSHSYRLEVPGAFHLVELQVRGGQTGVNEFRSRQLAIAALHGSIFECGIQLWGYSVLSDRVLLVVVPFGAHAIGRALMNADRRFVRRFSSAHYQALPFWERGYSVCPLADEVAWRVLRYVDRVSMPDGSDPLDPYAPNSAAEHAGLVKHGLLTAPPECLPSPVAWPVFLCSPEDEDFGQALEFCLRTGKPFGPLPFVRRVEDVCGRRVGSCSLKWSRLFDDRAQRSNSARQPSGPAIGNFLCA
jgi:hypothetical protein